MSGDRKSISVRNYDRVDHAGLRDVSGNLRYFVNFNTIISILNDRIVSLLNKFAPIKNVKVRQGLSTFGLLRGCTLHRILY